MSVLLPKVSMYPGHVSGQFKHGCTVALGTKCLVFVLSNVILFSGQVMVSLRQMLSTVYS